MKAILASPADKVDAISIHEAGHAVIALALRHRLSAVTVQGSGHIGVYIELRGSAARMFRERPDGVFVDVSIEKRQRCAREAVCIFLAGRESEQQILPDLSLPDSDRHDRELIARELPQALASGQEAADLLSQLEQRTRLMVRTYRDVIVFLATLLVSNTSLTAGEVRRACKLPMAIARRTATQKGGN